MSNIKPPRLSAKNKELWKPATKEDILKYLKNNGSPIGASVFRVEETGTLAKIDYEFLEKSGLKPGDIAEAYVIIFKKE